MVSDLWELETDGSDPSDLATLSVWGFSDGNLSFRNQSPDVLTLSIPEADALTADALFAFKQGITLYRDGAVFFKGRVARVPRDGRTRAERRSYEIRNVWWAMERETYLQAWTSRSGSSTTSVSTSRVLLGWDSGTSTRRSTKEAFLLLAVFLTTRGHSVVIDTTLMPTVYCPPIQVHNRKVSQIFQQLMRWHPDCVVSASYFSYGTVLRIVPRSAMGSELLNIGDVPLEQLSIVPLNELQVSSVHIFYETEAPVSEFAELEIEGEGESYEAFVTSRKLLVAEDVYPPGSVVTEDSLVYNLPGPPTLVPPQPGQQQPPHKQQLVTRVIPEDDATDTEAEQFWLDHSGFEVLGIETGDVRLPSSTVGDIRAHKVAFLPKDVVDPPSAINPNSTVVFDPDEVTDYPNEIAYGSPAEWMGIIWKQLKCSVTMGIRKSTVDGLEEEDRNQITSVARVGEVQGVPAYLVDMSVIVTGTDGRDGVYEQTPTTNPREATSDNLDDVNGDFADEAEEDAIIPNLALQVYNSRKDLPWAGSLPLKEEDAGGRRFLGKVLNLNHADRPEWLTMRALIQEERIDLVSGGTSITFGAGEHLSIQDHIAMHEAAKEVQQQRALNGFQPQDPGGDLEEPFDPDETVPKPAIFGSLDQNDSPPVIVPPRPLTELWRLRVTDSAAAKVKIANPGKIKKSAAVDNSGLVTVSGLTSEFTAVVGQYLLLECTRDLQVTLKTEAAWSAAPLFPIESEENPSGSGLYIVLKYRFPLYKFVSSGDAEDDAIPITGAIFAQKLAPSSHLRFMPVRDEDKDAHQVSAYELVPSLGAF